jgi:hypothetical protein
MFNTTKYSRKLNTSNYERPSVTITDAVQNRKDIEEQLANFEEIESDDVVYVNLNSQLKYITYDKKNRKELFRFGGLLTKINKDYLVLSGKNGYTFTVQRYTKNDKGDIVHKTRFFKKMKDNNVIPEELNQTTEIIDKQNTIIEQQRQELISMKKKLNKFQNS